MDAEMEKWMLERLRNGVSVEQQFPELYDSEHGFGYKIVLWYNGRQHNVLIRYKGAGKEGKCVKLMVCAVSHYTIRGEENIAGTELIGKNVILTPRAEDSNILSPYYAITGILTLQEEAP